MRVEFPSAAPLEYEFTIADRPALRQLARLDADYTNALVVLEAHRARVCEVVLGEFMAETAFASGAPSAPTDGWGRVRHQREIRAHPERHYREVSEALCAYLAQWPATLVILSGQQEALTCFQRFLLPCVQQQIGGAVRLDPGETHDRILQIADETLREHDRKEDWESVRLLIHAATRGGLAVLGLQDTLVAVNAGLVHKLVMQRDFRRPGWRCLICDNIGREEAPPSQCPICSGRVIAVELGEAMVTEVLRYDGFFASRVTPCLPEDLALPVCRGHRALPLYLLNPVKTTLGEPRYRQRTFSLDTRKRST